MKKIYIAENGNDNFDGSIEKPLRSLKKALELYHEKIQIIFRRGTYTITEGIEIVDGDDIEITAYENETVRIIGGYILDNTKAVPVTNEEVINRLLPEVRNKILQYDLSELKIRTDGKMPVGYETFADIPLELYINGKACQLSCFPKNSWIPIKEIIVPGESVMDGATERTGGSFRIENERILRWKYAKNAYIRGFIARGYACETAPVESIDTDNSIIKLKQNGIFGLNLHDDKRDFIILNLLEELSEENDYYFDVETNILYFYPPADYNEASEMVIASDDNPLITLINCTDVKISNLIFEMGYSSAVQIYSGMNNKISNCILRNFGKNGVSIGRDLGLGFEEVPLITSNRNFYEHEEGLYNRKILLAGENNVIENCKIHNCGSGAVYLAGGYRPSLKAGNNMVVGCDLYNCNLWQKSAPIIKLTGVGNIIKNCKIHDGTGTGIFTYGNEHIIEYNEFFGLCKEVDDCGAFYIAGDPAHRGNIIRYNYFHNMQSRREIKVPIKDGFGVFSVYIDDGASEAEVYGNVFYRGGNWAIANNGGSDIKVYNNIIIESESCIWHTDNQVGRYSEDNIPQPEPLRIGHSHKYYDKLLHEVKAFEPPFSTKYPHLLDLFKEAGYPQRNTAINNVVYNCLNFITTWHQKDQLIVNASYLKKEGESVYDVLKKYPIWYEQKGNIISSNLSFLDNMDNPDFDMINSKIKEMNPDFEAIPFEKIGLKQQ